MYRLSLLILALCMFSACSVSNSEDPVESPNKCERCTMDRNVYAHSRMLVVYDQNTAVGVCSLYCAIKVLQQNPDKQVRSLMVADYYTKKLLDARTAFWVVGGKKKGVMTALAKWAFASKADARRFVRKYGGELTSFEQAMNSATQEVMDLAAEEKKVAKEMLLERKR